MPSTPLMVDFNKFVSNQVYPLIDNVALYWKGYLEHFIDNPQEQLRLMYHNIDFAFNKLFGFHQMFAFFKTAMMLQGVLLGWDAFSSGFNFCTEFLTERGRLSRKLRLGLHNAKSFPEWFDFATQYDRLNGGLKWREDDSSQFYDEKKLRERIGNISRMTKNNDVFSLIYRLRGGLTRDKFSMQHEGLYTRALSGTKHITAEYLDTVCEALDTIADTPQHEKIPLAVRLAFFRETRRSFGRTALLLSGGAYLGYYHMGLARALYNQRMLPNVISGASAGSLIVALIGTRTDDELEELFENPTESFRSDHFAFGWQAKPIDSPVLDTIRSCLPDSIAYWADMAYCLLFWQKGLLLDIDHLKSVIIHNCGIYTFQEAFDRTGRIINVTVSPENNYDPPRLLNYLTAPHVCVWSAALASCAIPGAFDPVPLIAREPNGEYRAENRWTKSAQTMKRNFSFNASGANELKESRIGQCGSQAQASGNKDEVVLYTDGSVESDLPMQQLSEQFNVNHFIVSQVNPHSCLFSASSVTASVWAPALFGHCVGYVRFLKTLLKDWIKSLVGLVLYRTKGPVWAARRGVFQLLTQEYEGRDQDITIMPWKNHISLFAAFRDMIKNPTDEEYFAVADASEKAAWPYFARVSAHCAIETTLDECVARLRAVVETEDAPAPLPAGEMPEPLLPKSHQWRRSDAWKASSRQLDSFNDIPDPSTGWGKEKEEDRSSLSMTAPGDDVPLGGCGDTAEDCVMVYGNGAVDDSEWGHRNDRGRSESAGSDVGMPMSRSGSTASIASATGGGRRHSNSFSFVTDGDSEDEEAKPTLKRSTSISGFYYQNQKPSSLKDLRSMSFRSDSDA